MLHAWFASPTIRLMIWRRLIAVCLARTSFLQHGQGASVPAAWAVLPVGYWIRRQPSLTSTVWHSPRITNCSTASPWVILTNRRRQSQDARIWLSSWIKTDEGWCPVSGHQRLKIDMHLLETCRQNMKHLLQVLFCFGKNEINIFPRVIIENDNPIFLLF